MFIRCVNQAARKVYPCRKLGPSLSVFFLVLLAVPLLVVPTRCSGIEPMSVPLPDGATKLAPDQPVWIDPTVSKVLVDGKVAIREGVLEMFACPKGTKEHESVVAIEAQAYLIHVGLLRIGATTGSPVRYEPKYRPPTGSEIHVGVEWRDGGKKKTARAQDWIRDARTQKAMDLPFVFAGSGFWTDPDSGKQHYLAEAGDLICVSNFASAMLDVPVESSKSNEELWFEPFTDRIPPVGTPVRVVLSVADIQADGAVEK